MANPRLGIATSVERPPCLDGELLPRVFLLDRPFANINDRHRDVARTLEHKYMIEHIRERN